MTTAVKKPATPTKPALPEINRKTLPDFIFPHLGWNKRITKYLWQKKDVDKMRKDEQFTANPGPVYEIADMRLQEIGTFGSYETGILERIVEVTTPENSKHFPDLLGELCEDGSDKAPLKEWASADLRRRFDRVRFEFGEYALIGDQPRLMGHKKRRDQIRIVNLLSRAVSDGDKALARALAAQLADNIENLEPSAEL